MLINTILQGLQGMLKRNVWATFGFEKNEMNYEWVDRYQQSLHFSSIFFYLSEK